jgi:hypothetical protein
MVLIFDQDRARLFPALLPFTFRFTWCATARSLEGPKLNEAIRGSSGSVLHFERTRLACWERWRLELMLERTATSVE